MVRGPTRRLTAASGAAAPRLGHVDLAKVICLLAAFALLVTVHVALAAGLGARQPRWRGPVAFLVPPLAPYWGYAAGMRRRAVLWLLGLGLYVVARVFASL